MYSKLFSVFSQGSWTNFCETVFLWTGKILNTVSENLTQFNWNKVLYCFCSNKAKIWACCRSEGWTTWLCWVCICWFCIMSWLCCLSRASLSLFSSCQFTNLNSRSCSSLSWRKPNTFELHHLLCCYPQCHSHLAHYVFLSLQIFPLIFFFISWVSFFSFLLWRSFLIICFGSTLTFFRSLYNVIKKLFTSRELFTPWAGAFDFSCCFDLYLFMRVAKWSLRLRAVTPNFLRLSKLLAILCHTAPLTSSHQRCTMKKNVFLEIADIFL